MARNAANEIPSSGMNQPTPTTTTARIASSNGRREQAASSRRHRPAPTLGGAPAPPHQVAASDDGDETDHDEGYQDLIGDTEQDAHVAVYRPFRRLLQQ